MKGSDFYSLTHATTGESQWLEVCLDFKIPLQVSEHRRVPSPLSSWSFEPRDLSDFFFQSWHHVVLKSTLSQRPQVHFQGFNTGFSCPSHPCFLLFWEAGEAKARQALPFTPRRLLPSRSQSRTRWTRCRSSPGPIGSFGQITRPSPKPSLSCLPGFLFFDSSSPYKLSAQG